ncbi:MAG: sugar phosphate isomerase/epimerase [Actinomycetota bacterium]|nr:sugar phosphate isomerase/epimerase [Actinomycetota bacterium]
MIHLGIFAKTFSRRSLAETLDAVAAHHIEAIQFNMAVTGGPSLPAEIPEAASEAVRAAVSARGLTMSAVSGTYNMAHPDPGVRSDGQARLAALIAAAPALGTRVVTLCTGTRDPEDMWRAHPGNGSPEAWTDSLEQIAAALTVAERHDVVLAFEPEHNNVVGDAAAGRRLLDELRSEHLRVVLDAANLIRPGELHRQRDTLREAFELLGDALVLAHAKDVREDGTVVAAGSGGLDYALYAQLLRDAAFDGPLVLHGLSEEQVPTAADFVRAQLELVAHT